MKTFKHTPASHLWSDRKESDQGSIHYQTLVWRNKLHNWPSETRDISMLWFAERRWCCFNSPTWLQRGRFIAQKSSISQTASVLKAALKANVNESGLTALLCHEGRPVVPVFKGHRSGHLGAEPLFQHRPSVHSQADCLFTWRHHRDGEEFRRH